jgi:starch phosphorylase
MHPISRESDGVYLYEGSITPVQSGFHGFSVRVLPNHPDLITPFLPGLVAWAVNGQG